MAYEHLAAVYDELMQEIPYRDWAEYLVGLLKKYDVNGGLVLELGCGTGTMTECLARAGYDMTGIDSSPQMLQKALEKRDKSGLPILYLNQDIRDFELYGTMAAVVAVCDTMNYLIEEEDFVTALKLVNNYLDPGGVFIFDLKTDHYYRQTLGTCIQADSEENSACIWENEYEEETGLNYYDLTLFEKRSDGTFDRSRESQVQRAYSLDRVQQMAKQAGLEYVAAYTAFTKEEPREEADRLYVVLRESGKTRV